jgi:hypothetical protein
MPSYATFSPNSITLLSPQTLKVTYNGHNGKARRLAITGSILTKQFNPYNQKISLIPFNLLIPHIILTPLSLFSHPSCLSGEQDLFGASLLFSSPRPKLTYALNLSDFVQLMLSTLLTLR